MIDGTGQKRRFTSKSGIFCVLSVRTGEVLNYEVLSEVCFECRANEQKGRIMMSSGLGARSMREYVQLIIQGQMVKWDQRAQ